MSLLATRPTADRDDRYGPPPAKPWLQVAVHPLLVAVFTPLALYAQAPLHAAPNELLGAILACAGGVLVCWLLFAWLFGGWNRGALAASGLTILLFSFGLGVEASERLIPFGLWVRPHWLVGIWGVVLLGGGVWLRKPRRDVAQMTYWMNILAILALAGPLLVSGFAWVRNPGLILTAAPVASADADPAGWATPRKLPDIYYLVVRRYPNYRTLKVEGGIDNRPFLRALVQRGFVVATRSHSNYPRHDLTVAAALQLDYFPSNLPTRQDSALSLSDSAAPRLLKPLGYSYCFMPGSREALRNPPQADRVFRTSPLPYTLAVESGACTPRPRFWCGRTPAEAAAARRSWLLAQAEDPAPTFTVACLDLGEPKLISPAAGGKSTPDSRFEAANEQLLATIDAILAKSPQPPIIILQSDEGALLNPQTDAGRPLANLARKRCGILTAVLLPAGTRDSVPMTLSPVNSLRLALRAGVAAPLELLPDRIYYWQPADEFGRADAWQPCRLNDVTAEVFGREDAPNAEGEEAAETSE